MPRIGETYKAHDRRVRERWYQRFIRTPGLDVGSGTDPLPAAKFLHWDYEWSYKELDGGKSLQPYADPGDRDAQTLKGLADESFYTVYASHILEHLPDPHEALRNWWRVLKPDGNLIVVVPHRDLYEKKRTHPSRWNPRDRDGGGGHLTFWLPNEDDPPDTLSFVRVLYESLPGNAELQDFRVVDEGYDYSLPPDVHPVGEYAIEVVIKKPFFPAIPPAAI